MGLGSSVIRHANCRGVTAAVHYVCFGNISNKPTIWVPCVPRILSHIINPAEKTIRRPQVEAPLPLVGPIPREPIISDGLLRRDDLLDVHSPTREILRPSVFVASGWVRGCLAATEYLHAYDIPLALFPAILASERLPLGAIGKSLSSLLVTTLFHAIWSENFGGGSRESDS